MRYYILAQILLIILSQLLSQSHELESCQLGQFYSKTQQSCQSCHSSCSSTICFGSGQDDCLSCPQNSATLIFNVETLKCSSKDQWDANGGWLGTGAYDFGLTYFDKNQTGEIEIKWHSTSVKIYDANTKTSTGSTYQIRRSNLIYVDPQSNQSIELGTLSNPFKTIDQAFLAIYHSFYFNDTYWPKVYLAIEQSSTIHLSQNMILDSIDLLLLTYDKTSKILNFLPLDYAGTKSLPIKVNITITTNTQPVVKISSYLLAYSLSYDFAQKQAKTETNLYRKQRLLYKMQKYSKGYINMYNCKFIMSSVGFYQGESGFITREDNNLIKVISGGSLNQLQIINSEYHLNLKFIRAQTNSEITIQKSAFNLSKLKQMLIVYEPNLHDISCASNSYGNLKMENNNFYGVYNNLEGKLIQYKGYSNLNFNKNNLTDVYFTSIIDIIDFQLEDYCTAKLSPTASTIQLNFISNIYSNSTLLSSYPSINLHLNSSYLPVQVSISEFKLQNLSTQESTLFYISSYSPPNKLLTIDLSLSLTNYTQQNSFGDSDISLIKIFSRNSQVQINVKDLTVSGGSMNRFLSVDVPAQLTNIIFSKVVVTGYSDVNNGFGSKQFINIVGTQNIAITSLEVQNSTFSSQSFLFIKKVKEIKIEKLSVTNCYFSKENFIQLEKTQLINIQNVNLEQNQVSKNGKSHLIYLEKIICQNYSNPLTIKNFNAINSNQLPLVYTQDFLEIIPSVFTQYLLEISNGTIVSNSLNNHNFITMSSPTALKMAMLLKDLTFTQNTITNNFVILMLEIYSQSIQIVNCTFQNNSGKLIEIDPSQIKYTEKGTSFNSKVFTTNLVMTGNKNQEFPLIALNKQTYMEMVGSKSDISNNMALGIKGVISLGSSHCKLDINGITFSNNFAYYGGVFSVQNFGTLTCIFCTFKNNVAGTASIAYVANNGKIIINNGVFQANYALTAQLFYLITNGLQQSEIKDSDILDYDSSSTAQKFIKIKKLIVDKYSGFNSYQQIENDKNKDQDSNSIQVQRSKILIQNTKIYNQSNFINLAIDSQLQIINCDFQNLKQVGYIINALLSTIKIEDTDFTRIIKKDPLVEIYLFQITVESTLTIDDCTFNTITTSLASIYNSVFFMFNTELTSLNYTDYFILSKYSAINTENSNFNILRSGTKAPLYKVFEQSNLTLIQINVVNFNSRIIDVKASQVKINHSSFSNFTYTQKGEIFDQGVAISSLASEIEIYNATFMNLQTSIKGAAIYSLFKKREGQANQISIKISESRFIKCKSVSGGAIYSDNVNIYIQNSNFTLNEAETGGSIYFSCCTDCQQSCSYQLQDSICSNNSASIKGGCFFTNIYGIQNYETTKYQFNKAIYGQDYAAYPFAVERMTRREDGNFEILKTALIFVSGQSIEEPFYFGLRDMYGQIINIENSAIGKINPNSKDLQINIQDQSISSSGIFEFTQTEFVSRPGYSGNFNFTTDSIDESIYFKASKKIYQPLSIFLQLRYCTFGEAIEGYKCIVCQPGTYSLSENAETCEVCPDHASCQEDEINPDEGYWRSSNQSIQVSRCYYQNACPGKTYNACVTASGYTGILCHECIYNDDDPEFQFTRDGQHKCSRCPGVDQNVRTYLLVFFSYQAYIFYLTFSYYNNLILEKENSILLRILTTYLQIVNLIGSFELNWPQIINQFFEGLKSPAQVTEALYSVDCLLKDFGVRGNEQTVMISLLITTLQPFIQFFLAIFVYLFAWIFRVKRLKVKILVTMTVIFYLTFPKIIQDTFSLFTCTDDIDGKKYLVKNTYIECYGSTHTKLILLLGIPNMVVWIFGFPSFILYVLYKRRNDLDNHDNLRLLGFWYLGCKRRYFYWELLIECKKLMLISITVDVTGMGQSYQAFLILMVLYFYFLLSSNLKPYKTSYLNKVSYYNELAQLCSFAFMMIYFRPSTNIVIDNMVFVLLILMNSLFLGRFLYYFGKFYYIMVKDMYNKFFGNKIKKRSKDEEIDSDESNSQQANDDQDFDKIKDKSLGFQVDKTKKQKRKMPKVKIYKHSSQSKKQNPDISNPNSLTGSPKSQKSIANVSSNDQSSNQPQNEQKLTEDEKIAEKIEKIRILKEKKKLNKRKLLIQDGPLNIKLDDYLREEKTRLKILQNTEEEKKERVTKQTEEEIKEREEQIQVKDFDIKIDKDGHLLNQQVLDQIGKLL